MKKIIFGIFAHPDDEAFTGVAGALLLEVQAGTELHLILLTDGAAGTNPDALPNLGEERLEEWRAAGELLGAASVHHFGYADGQLNNEIMTEAGARAMELARGILATAPVDATVEFITLDLNGYTGHIDHIVAARTAAWVFYRLKATDSRLSRIRFACLPEQLAPQQNTDWIFMEKGRSPQEVDETIDARGLRDQIAAIVQTHHTQRADGQAYMASAGDSLGMGYFIVRH